MKHTFCINSNGATEPVERQTIVREDGDGVDDARVASASCTVVLARVIDRDRRCCNVYILCKFR